MDRRDLVEELQKAFNDDSRVRNTDDIHDVEYKENTNGIPECAMRHNQGIQKEYKTHTRVCHAS